MHFYRSMSAIKAITFDLDDTLYDNSSIVEKAEAEVMKVLQKYAGLQDITLAQFNSEKKVLLDNNPEIYHDVVLWRVETLRYVLSKNSSSSLSQINTIVDESMTTFNEWRHKMQIPQSTHILLTKLARKYPLAVVTNGNVEIERVGLDEYFQFSLRGGEHLRSKPFPEVFMLAAEKLALPAHQILHVGDSLFADVNGAIKSGMQACWLNICDQDILHLPEARCLPHIEISQLSELDNLL